MLQTSEWIDVSYGLSAKRIKCDLVPDKGVLTFRYEQSWIESDLRRPISLSLPLAGREYSGPLVENYFDNLLPDSQPIRNRLQVRTRAESGRCFDLLAKIGRDCIGALQLLPEGEQQQVRTVQAQPLTEMEIAAILRNYQAMPLGVDLETDFRISLAGAQEKTALLLHNGRWCRPAGATPTSHLIKLPIGELGRSGIDLSTSVENEWLCLRLLAAFELPVAPAEMHIFGDQKVLVVERFDRRWAEDGNWLMRLPQEDMCQASGVSGIRKYEADGGPGMQRIMDILLGSLNGREDRTTFMKAQLVFWMLAVIDGHAKNFSIAHLAGGLYRLTPFYDVISVHPLVAIRRIDRQKVSMAMAVHGKQRHCKWDMISRRHWLDTARKCRFPPDEMNLIIEACCDQAETVIDAVSGQLPPGFPMDTAAAIFAGIRGARQRLRRA